MARVLFFTILAMCLVCIIQASPVPDQSQTQPQPQEADLVEEIKTAGENLAKAVTAGVQQIINNPELKKTLDKLVKGAKDGIDQLQSTAENAFPKTQ